jgi:hypothetical protein
MKMKKIFLTVCVIMLAAAMASADDIQMNFSGEVKTGLLWDKIEEPGSATINRTRLGNNDDAGIPGRIRLDGELIKNNVGFKMRWETTNFQNNIAPAWAYVYAYGDFINEQLRLSGGRLGQSPWSSGGYEIWDELDNRAGLRVEVKPNFLSGLNVGFVLNQHNTNTSNTEVTLLGILEESIVGVAYTHDFFEIRAAYRFDSDEDSHLDNMGLSEGHDFIYRVEEKALRNVVEGLSIWANGKLIGIAAKNTAIINYINWLYIQYNPGALDVQLRTGIDAGYEKWYFKLKPVISYGITDFLRLGATFYYYKDFGEAAPAKDAPYKVLAFEPLVRVTFNNMYVDLAYQFGREYTAANRIKQTNWVNLRFVYTF